MNLTSGSLDTFVAKLQMHAEQAAAHQVGVRDRVPPNGNRHHDHRAAQRPDRDPAGQLRVPAPGRPGRHVLAARRRASGFSVDLRPESGDLVGYRAKPHTGVIDLSKIAYYEPSDYWEPIHSKDGWIILDPGAFYILVSREAITIPPDCAAEMAPYLAMVGEFRVHYAGFFDPGFGHDAAGGSGSRGVLEVRCHEAPFVLEHGQVVGRLVYERMTEPPETLYGADIKSNYQGQGLKLSKHFQS